MQRRLPIQTGIIQRVLVQFARRREGARLVIGKLAHVDIAGVVAVAVADYSFAVAAALI